MSERFAFSEALLGRDATHRTRKFNTHLTHGCIQLFRHFSRVRLDYGERSAIQIRPFPPVSESAIRTLAGVVR